MAKKKIEDFGEEIFGARKHLAQLNRELRATDIGDWTDAEREQNVTKNTAFPKVDYKKEYADGKDREVLYFIKTLRDKLPTQPLYPLKSLYTPEQLPEAKRQAQEDYLTTVSYVYQKAMQLEKPEDFKKFFNEVSAAKLPKSDKILKDAKKVLDFDGRWGEYTYQRFQSKLEKNKFCFSDKEKLLSNYEIYKYDGKNVKRDEQLSKAYHKDYMNVSFGYGKRIFLANNETEANPDNWKQDTYFAIAKSKVDLIAMNIPSREALEEKLVAIEQEKPQTEKAKKAGKKALKPLQLQHIRPTTEDYRQGKPVVENDFMKDSSMGVAINYDADLQASVETASVDKAMDIEADLKDKLQSKIKENEGVEATVTVDLDYYDKVDEVATFNVNIQFEDEGTVKFAEFDGDYYQPPDADDLIHEERDLEGIIDEAMADLGYPDANAEITADRSDDVDKIFEKAYESYDNPEYDEIEPDFD